MYAYNVIHTLMNLIVLWFDSDLVEYDDDMNLVDCNNDIIVRQCSNDIDVKSSRNFFDNEKYVVVDNFGQ